MKNYKYVLRFSDKKVDSKLIHLALTHAWESTPSKNNFMNYSVHVLGPNNTNLRQKLYEKCLKQQMQSNDTHFNNLLDYDKYLNDINAAPNFRNILSAPYILIYTQRVETVVNKLQQINIDKGMVFEQMFPVGTKKYHSASALARFETGMFSANFASKCLQLGIDVSYIGCMPVELENWQESEWNFITDKPIIIQLAGYGEVYKKDVFDPSSDLKPDFERVVNIL